MKIDRIVSSGRSRQLTLLGAALMASLALFLMAASSASALNLGLMWTGDYNQASSEMEVVGKSGAGLFRVPVTPDHSSNGNDWNYYDTVFGNAAKNGVTILPQVAGRLNGGSGLPSSGEKTTWTEWVQKAVRRYGYNGVYWSTHPEVPARPVFAWEMWNEPNNASLGSITAAEFGAFLAWAGSAVQSASESWGKAKTGVLFGGLLAWSSGTGYQTYLKNAYKVAGVSSAITGIAIHPYELDTSAFPGKTRIQAFEGAVNGARTFINKELSGGSGKSLWITETGWPAAAEYSVGEAEQANLLKQSFDWTKSNASSLNIQAIIWYNYRDLNVGIWQYRCGLRDQDGAYRQSWWAFQEETGADTWPRGAGPAVSITSDGRLFATAMGPNHSLQFIERHADWAWQSPVTVAGPGTTYSKPASIIDKGNLLVFTQGPNHTLQETMRFEDGSWHGPYEVGGPGSAYSAPTVVMDSSEDVFVMAEGYNHTLQETQRYGDWSWHGPYEVGPSGAAYSAPTAVMDSSGDIFVMAEGANHTLQETQRYGDWSWHGPYLVGPSGAAYSPPAAVMDSAGDLFTLAEGANHTLQNTQRYGDWSWHGPYLVAPSGTVF